MDDVCVYATSLISVWGLSMKTDLNLRQYTYMYDAQ